MKQRAIKCAITLDPEEHRELWMFAMHRHVGGQSPVASILKEAAFAYMAKYAIPETKRAALEAKYAEAFQEAKAVQPDALGEGRVEGSI